MWLKSCVLTIGLGLLCAIPFPSQTHPIASPLPSPISAPTPTLDDVVASIRAAHAAIVRGAAIDYVIDQEGGYADHLHDPGGPTNFGITQKTARRFGYKGRMSNMPVDWAYLIYRQLWTESDSQLIAQSYGDENAIQYFNAYVQHGPVIRKDWHPNQNLRITCINLNIARMRLYQRSSNWTTFKRGWSARISQNIKRCENA
jgi:lysozyme family protein